MTPAVGLPGDVGQLEAVPVQVDRMDVVAGVAHTKAVALALPQVEGRGCDIALVMGKATPLMVQRLKPSIGGVVFGESHLEGLIGRGGGGARLGEARIVPAERFGGATHCGLPVRPAYSTTMPMP